MDARSTNRKNGSTRRVTLHRGCLGVGNHPPTSKDGKSLITHDSHSERTKGRKQKQDSPRNAPPNPPHLAPRPPRSPLRQRQQWTSSACGDPDAKANKWRTTDRTISLSLSLSQTPPNHPRPAPRPPRSPPGQQQRWTSITRSPAATSMRKQSK